MDARHWKFIRQIKLERKKNIIQFPIRRASGVQILLKTAFVYLCGHAYASFVLLFGLCIHIIFNGFALFFLVKYFTALSHRVMCYFKHVVNYSTILSLTSLVHVNCNSYFCRQFSFVNFKTRRFTTTTRFSKYLCVNINFEFDH